MKHSKGARTGLAIVLAAVTLTTAQLSAPAAGAATPAQEWAEVSSLLSAITDAYTAPPALNTVVTTGYTSGLLLGNGDMAVTADARDHAQTLYLAKSDFWHAGNGQLHVGKITIRDPAEGVITPSAKDTLECSASCAIDGDPNTRWVSSTNAGAAAPQWVTVDLGLAAS